MNPGGPGASGIELAKAATRFLPKAVTDRFDVVGWDPRGVGASAPVDCGVRLDYLFSGDTSPEDATEWTALDDVSRRFAHECGSRSSADLLANISTLATVRDMERIRRGLGEDRINYLGFSYGTEVGAFYATLYPQRVGRWCSTEPSTLRCRRSSPPPNRRKVSSRDSNSSSPTAPATAAARSGAIRRGSRRRDGGDRGGTHARPRARQDRC